MPIFGKLYPENFADRQSYRRVRAPTVELARRIKLDDVTFAKRSPSRYTVNHLFVDRNAGHGGKWHLRARISLE